MSVYGTKVVYGSQDLTLRLWTHKDRRWERTSMEGQMRDVECVSVRADKIQIVFGLDDCSLYLGKVQDAAR